MIKNSERKAVFLFVTAVFFCLTAVSGYGQTSSSRESITITTYYPSPYGAYKEIRSNRMAIGGNYRDPSRYCWEGTCTNIISSERDLVVEGTVGIGTTGSTSSPIFKMILQDNDAINPNGNNFTGLLLRNLHAISSAKIHFRAGDASTSQHWALAARSNTLNHGSFALVEGVDGTAEARLMVLPGGNVGIGESNPADKLVVNGDVRIRGDVKGRAFYYTSDGSLKENIFTLGNVLDKVRQLRGVSFQWKEDGRQDMGLIAQEVEKIFPEVVSTNPASGLKSVEYGNLVAVLIEAVKEQQERIDGLTAEIEEMKGK